MTAVQAEQAFKYQVFISYSHADQEWGRWLHGALERFKPPKERVGQETSARLMPSRFGRVFRDDAELGAASDLPARIDAALIQSNALVVICSPKAARSPWVNREIAAFKERRGNGRVLAVIVDGEPHSKNPETECFPPALLASFEASRSEEIEPFAPDVRKFGRQDTILKLVSGIWDIDYDALKRRALIEQRRRLRRTVAIASGLSIVFAGLALFSTFESIEAGKQRDAALLASSRALAPKPIKASRWFSSSCPIGT